MTEDQYNLERFVTAQDGRVAGDATAYETAVAELRAGRELPCCNHHPPILACVRMVCVYFDRQSSGFTYHLAIINVANGPHPHEGESAQHREHAKPGADTDLRERVAAIIRDRR